MCDNCKNKGNCKYTNSPKFKGSISENSIKSCTDRSQLLYRLGYEKGAIKYHEKEGNQCQIEFFSSCAKLIEKMLKLKRFQEV